MAGTQNDSASGNDVFDVANWIDRANGRTVAPAAAVSAHVPTAYEPRHRADVPVDSVA